MPVQPMTTPEVFPTVRDPSAEAEVMVHMVQR